MNMSVRVLPDVSFSPTIANGRTVHTEGFSLELLIFDWGWKISIVYDALGIDTRSQALNTKFYTPE